METGEGEGKAGQGEGGQMEGKVRRYRIWRWKQIDLERFDKKDRIPIVTYKKNNNNGEMNNNEWRMLMWTDEAKFRLLH